jgi:ABC-type thiamin/hydroxymethylpyrimidine transport system permease subunit
MLSGTVQIVAFVVELVRHGGINNQWGAELRLTVIEVVDLFLIGTVLFVIAVGLYQLFGTTTMPLPAGWWCMRWVSWSASSSGWSSRSCRWCSWARS